MERSCARLAMNSGVQRRALGPEAGLGAAQTAVARIGGSDRTPSGPGAQSARSCFSTVINSSTVKGSGGVTEGGCRGGESLTSRLSSSVTSDGPIGFFERWSAKTSGLRGQNPKP